MTLGIIGGTGFEDLGAREQQVHTPFGGITVQVGTLGGVETVFVARHGKNHRLPPHRVNYRGIISALKELGVREVLATASVGSLKQELQPGQMVLLDQFIDFTKNRSQTFFEGDGPGVVHVDMTEPYCPRLRRVLQEAASAGGLATLHEKGTYVATEGPRFETPAEIRMYRLLGGEVVGMTNVPEVVLAREAELCYAAVAVVTNWAAGISPYPLTHGEVLETMAKARSQLKELFNRAAGLLDGGNWGYCTCPHALAELGKF